jgi:nucleoside diphosphate kinase
MSDTVNVDTPAVDTPPVVAPDANLPSTQESTTLDTTKWDVNSLADKFTDGKLHGQFESVDDLSSAFMELQKKHANYVREVKDGVKNDEQTLDQIQETRKQEETQNQTMNELVASLVTGSEVTDEVIAKAEEAGLDIRDVKLNAIEAKEAVQKAYNIVGGQEEYQAMQEWAKDNLSEAQIKEFDKNLSSPSSELFIKGLHTRYRESGNQDTSAQPTDTTPTQRISGEPTSVGVIGYATQAEMLRDAAYVNSPRGAQDAGAREQYAKRMAKTPNNVIYG